MNKIVNVVLQIVFVLIFAGVAFVMQGADVDGAISNGQLGVFILCIPLCWLILRFFKSVWFYFSVIALLLGFLGGYLCVKFNNDLSVDTLGQSLTGYIVILFAVFLFLGIAMACVRENFGLVFMSRLKMPLSAWVIIALLLDFVLELMFFEQNFGVILLEVKAMALLCGLLIGLVAKLSSVALSKSVGLDLQSFCLIGASSEVGESAYLEDMPGTVPSRGPSAPVRPVSAPVPAPGRPAAQPGFAMRTPVAPKVTKEPSKMSVLDAKLEALCGGAVKDEKAEEKKKVTPPVSAPGERPPPASGEEESPEKKEPPKTTATHKIVSSVDFG